MSNSTTVPLTMIRGAIDTVMTYSGRAAFLLFNLIYLLSMYLLSYLLPKETWLRTSRAWGRICLFLLRTRWEAHGLERLKIPASDEVVFAAMHSSLLDTFLFPAILPSNTIYVAKESLRRFPLLGPLLRRTGFIFVSRNRTYSDARRFLATVRDLPSGTPLFLHPEGTRVPDGTARQGFSGFAVAARQRSAWVVPLTSSGGSRLWRRGDRFPRPGNVVVQVEEAWHPDDVTNATVEQLCARYEALTTMTPDARSVDSHAEIPPVSNSSTRQRTQPVSDPRGVLRVQTKRSPLV